jgi:hypothetical protein
MRILVGLLAVAPFVALIVAALTGRAAVRACCVRPVEAEEPRTQIPASVAPAVDPPTHRMSPSTPARVARS